MTFLEIIRHPITDLPIQYTRPFREEINSRIKLFGEILDSSDNLCDGMNDKTFHEDYFKKNNRILRDGILKAVDVYYEGNPSGAYITLKEALEKSHLSNFLDKKSELPANSSLFRIRPINSNYALSKEEMFHIPFELRTKVNTQRYSIPGLPSLYLSNSIYVAWEELKRPGISEIQAARIVNNNSLNLLDLTSDIFSKNDHLENNFSYSWSLLYKVMVWPLIAACSFKVKNPLDSFKPEYIIPQLLLQWVNKSFIYGIKYSSTHINRKEDNHDGYFYNVVIPVRTFNKEEGHCSQLLAAFRSTQVLPLQIRQFVTVSDRLAHQPSIQSNVNPDISGIELIKGYIQPYSSTIFGMLEHNLHGIETANFD
ncbi:hypothetical protein [Edaphocola aurantiacus]|uniref:hypothetical protein n=1 Tax=Edaphocola aurantiacus TaxID=2601682 RepID=UPI001C952906|nr:hypothetical protein [Edaphocola aurantiacus]